MFDTIGRLLGISVGAQLREQELAAPRRVAHLLKVDVKYWEALRSGAKLFELRLNDREYRVGDELVLVPTLSNGEGWFLSDDPSWNPHLRFRIIFILSDADMPQALKDGYSILGLERLA